MAFNGKILKSLKILLGGHQEICGHILNTKYTIRFMRHQIFDKNGSHPGNQQHLKQMKKMHRGSEEEISHSILE